jgi:hypothetical protein
MAKKKNLEQSAKIIHTNVGVSLEAIQMALTEVMKAGELITHDHVLAHAKERHSETLRDFGQMPREGLLESISYAQGFTEAHADQHAKMKAALVLMATFLDLLPYIGGLAIAEQASEKARVAGEASGDARKENARCTPDQVKEAYQRLLSEGKEKRGIAGILAKRYGVTADHIRKLLRKKSTTEPSTDR